jgi:FKBP-type peptidyl-prolyl cis-trans isomerase FklB
MNKITIAGLSAVTLFAFNAAAAEVELKTDFDEVNYSVGHQIGTDFKNQGIELNEDAMIKGMQDALAGEHSLMTPDEMRTALTKMAKKIAEKQQQKQIETAKDNLAKANAFLDENGKKDGVKTADSGLQYKIVEAGSGTSPQANDNVTVHYKGTLIDGKEFDSSYKREKPMTFQVNKVIAGWTEALQMMKPGAKWQLYIPPKLGYGAQGAGPIPANSVLIFDVELISVNEQSKGS